MIYGGSVAFIYYVPDPASDKTWVATSLNLLRTYHSVPKFNERSDKILVHNFSLYFGTEWYFPSIHTWCATGSKHERD